jgi:L-threonylcarbamoyladenylate synthase
MPLLHGSDAAAIHAAAQHLANGELVAFATETVYGLGARADDVDAVARIYAAKGRPAAHPLIVHVADERSVMHFAAEVSPSARRLMAAFWPGPLTLIVPRRSGMATAAAGGQDSIGLRLPAHPVALALLRAAAALGVPGVAAPSANRFGRVSPTLAHHVQQEFGPALWVLDGGPSEVGIESTIVDCTRAAPALLRPGQLGRAAIEAVLGQPLAAPDATSPRASGTLASHYAPAAPVRLFDSVAWRHLAEPAGHKPGTVVGVYSRVALEPGPAWRHRRMPADAAAVAHELFAVLRDFDAAGVAAIWVERPPPGAPWDGVRDRLQRAAA